MQAEEQEGDEIEEGRPCHRILRAQYTGGDDGGDGICGVVETVQKIEEQRDGDKADKQRQCKRDIHQTFSITMPLISFATSSKRSTTFSSSP